MSARAGGAPFLRHYVDANQQLYKQFLMGIGELGVWLVDGELIRDKIYIDFTEGGNSNAYPWFPPRQIWIDDVGVKELKNTLVHELREYLTMAKGSSYENAHSHAANPLEQKVRSTPSLFPVIWRGLVQEYNKLLRTMEPDLTARKRPQ